MAWWSLVLLACWLDWTSASGRVVVYTLGTDQDDVELLPGVVYHTQPLIQPYPTTQPKAESIIGEPDVPVEVTTLTYGPSSNIRVAPGSPGKSYSWKEKGYTSCSASCLGGVQELIIQCVRDEDGKNASPYMCDPLTKPENRVRTCNDHPCPPRWNFTEFSQCTKSCGIGKQTRKISCIHEVTREDTITVPNSMCPQPPPPDRQYCTSSKCSKTCGGGIKQREIIDEFSAQPADFGAPLREDGVSGVLTLADPPDGCSALAPAPEGALWAVLIARYNCTFEVKIRNAQAAGFGLAIVHNVNSSDLEIMGTRDPEGVEIPSVFVSDIAGFALAGNYLHGTGYYVVAIGNGGGEPKSMNMKKKSLLLWIVVGVLCVFMIGILVMKFIRDKPSQRLLGKGAPCDDKLSSEDTLKGTPSSKEEEEANSCISSAVA